MIINLAIGANTICGLQPGKRYTFRLTTGADFTATLTPYEDDGVTQSAFTASADATSAISYVFADVAETAVGFEFVATKREFGITSTAAVTVDIEIVAHN